MCIKINKIILTINLECLASIPHKYNKHKRISKGKVSVK
jgi:hypothetical protein